MKTNVLGVVEMKTWIVPRKLFWYWIVPFKLSKKDSKYHDMCKIKKNDEKKKKKRKRKDGEHKSTGNKSERAPLSSSPT